ncbi:hypothetical protein FACS1894137_10350 [Spirochaetia bacterium]|nr:hypothetical protein FACS1894137_10350 [Spirochaetia bacterium]
MVDPLGAAANVGDLWTTILKTPVTGHDLPNMLQTHLGWLLVNFSEADRGKVVWFSVRLVNAKGDTGDFGPLYSAVAP